MFAPPLAVYLTVGGGVYDAAEALAGTSTATVIASRRLRMSDLLLSFTGLQDGRRGQTKTATSKHV
jgi:hypothetical protein